MNTEILPLEFLQDNNKQKLRQIIRRNYNQILLDRLSSKTTKQKMRSWLWRHDSLNRLYYEFAKIGVTNRLTAPLRKLPDFMLLGFPKCGTTSLYNYLIQHKQIHKTKKKEIHFFSYGYSLGLNWYRSHFSRSKDLLDFDSSVNTVLNPEAAMRIQKHIPNCKFIVMLRDPIEQCYSQYRAIEQTGLETYSFEESIGQDPIRFRRYTTILKNDFYRPYRQPIIIPYLSFARYDMWLKPFIERFPKNRFLFINLKDLENKPNETLNEIFEFLGIDKQPIVDLQKHNVNEYIQMNQTMKKKLSSLLDNTISNVEKITNLNFYD